METESGRSEASSALRTEELKAEIETLQNDVLDRTQAVTDRKEAKQQLSAVNETLQAEILARTRAETQFNQIFEATPDMMAVGAFDGYYKRVNPAMLQTMGYSEAEMLRTSLHHLIHPDDIATTGEQRGLLARGQESHNIYYRLRHKAGHYLYTEWTDVPMVEGGLFFSMGRDVTARRALEDSLHGALASMRYAQRIGMVGSWDVDAATGVSEWSDETVRICGLTRGAFTPHLDVFFSLVHPDDVERVRTAVALPLPAGEQRALEYRLILEDGTARDVLTKMEMVYSPDGTPWRLRGTIQDVSEQRTALLDRTKLEEQLRLAQKMEAVGSLAGGIAHDFNNLLSVILSYVGFVVNALPEGDSRRDDLAEAQKAAERATSLTRQLLAFGRKQVLQPVPLNLNHVAAEMEQMLRRIIGEDVSMVQRLDPELGLAMADPGQIEQVVMNLVGNSRDAMPLGGRLTIETANADFERDDVAGLDAGPYVILSVSDNGSGMDAATQARAFEPFFTTKDPGRGTGLGLSTAYGIVKQSGGNVSVYSELGVGTTIRVYLPRTSDLAPTVAEPLASAMPAVGHETVLVVEDEEGVRNSAARILSAAGYTVLTAENGIEALRQFDVPEREIALVLTDVVMPKMSGAVLTRELARQWPRTRVLMMSGYSGDAIVHKGILDPGTQFIGKPFNATDLTRKVRTLLDAGPEATPPEADWLLTL
jgi:PAS domain S-box-containing protein